MFELIHQVVVTLVAQGLAAMVRVSIEMLSISFLLYLALRAVYGFVVRTSVIVHGSSVMHAMHRHPIVRSRTARPGESAPKVCSCGSTIVPPPWGQLVFSPLWKKFIRKRGTTHHCDHSPLVTSSRHQPTPAQPSPAWPANTLVMNTVATMYICTYVLL